MKTIRFVLLPLCLAACATTANPAAGMPPGCMTEMLHGFPEGASTPNGLADLEDVEPPRKLHSPPPEPPQTGPSEGYACVQATIDTDGRVRESRILGTNSPDYAANVVRALEEWRFAPATIDGTSVSVYYHLVSRYSR